MKHIKQKTRRPIIIGLLLLIPNFLVAEQNKSGAITPENIYIMGEGTLDLKTIIFYMKKNNPRLNTNRIKLIYSIYKTESEIEGINYDVALAQMMLETGFLSYQGDVNPHQFNFAGIGALGSGTHGAIFSNLQKGIRAQIQHLHAYGCKKPLTQKQVDPRYHLVRRGTAPTISELTGHWAMDPKYAQSIFRILKSLYKIQKTNDSV